MSSVCSKVLPVVSSPSLESARGFSNKLHSGPDTYEPNPLNKNNEILLENLGLCIFAASLIVRENDHTDTNIAGKIIRSAKATRAQHGSYEDFDDFVQNACIEFLKSAEKHDPDRGSMSTYMTINLLSSIQNGISNSSIGRRIPINATKSTNKTEFISLIDEPDLEGYGFNDESDGYGGRSLPEEDMARTPIFDIEDVSVAQEFENIEIRAEADSLKEIINEKDFNVLLDRFGREKLLIEIADELGVSKQAIYQRICRILSKIQIANDQLTTDKQGEDYIQKLEELAKLKAENTDSFIVDGVVYAKGQKIYKKIK